MVRAAQGREHLGADLRHRPGSGLFQMVFAGHSFTVSYGMSRSLTYLKHSASCLNTVIAAYVLAVLRCCGSL